MNLNRKTIMLIGGINALRLRVEAIVYKHNVNIFIARNVFEAIPIISNHREEIKMIIIDGDMIDLQSVKRISSSARFLPILFMSSYVGRKHILEAISSGAHDYLLKPFEDKDLESRVLKNITNFYGNISTEVFIDLKTYLVGEFKKAIKGNYPITCMYINLNSIDTEEKIDYSKETPILFDSFRQLFWETDVFIMYGNRNFFGVFPFCNPINARLIEDKILNNFATINREKNNIKLEIDFISYPEDVSEAEEVLKALINKKTV